MHLDRRTAEGFFDRKMPGARRVERARHVGYHVVSKQGTVLLPVLTISRGSSGADLDFRNVKGLADDIGLTLEGLVEACRCKMRAPYVIFCAAVRVVLHCHLMFRMDSVAFNASMVDAMRDSVTSWLEEVRPARELKPSARELKEGSRALGRLVNGCTGEAFSEIAVYLQSYATAGLGIAKH